MSTKFPTAKLSEIAELNPTLGKKLPADELISFVPMASLSAETAKVETTQDRPYSEVSKGFTPFLNGDVLFAKITPCFENGKIAQANLPRLHGFGSTEFHVIRSRPEVSDARYLHHYLRLDSLRAEGQRRMTGSGGQRRVPSSFLAELQVPLPSLPEQRRIAAILDQAETLRTQRRTALAQLDSLTQSIFLDMFGDPKINHLNLPKAPLGDLMKLKSGNFLPASQMAVDGEFPVYGGNGINGSHDAFMFEEPKIVIGRVGAYCGCVHVTKPCSWVTDNALYLETISGSLQSEYLAFALTEARLNQYASQSGQPLISGARLAPIPLLIPPLPLQQTFATRIQAIEALKASHRSALTALDAIFAALQQRAFAGQL